MNTILKDAVGYAFGLQLINISNLVRLAMEFMFSFTDFRPRLITRHHDIRTFLTNTKMKSNYTCNGLPTDYFIGYNFMGWTNYRDEDISPIMWIWSSQSVIDEISKQKKISDTTMPCAIESDITEIKGNETLLVTVHPSSLRVIYQNFHSSLIPTDAQLKVCNKIIELYNKKGHVMLYIHGPPRTGKSSISFLLAQFIGDAAIATNINMTRPNPGIPWIYDLVMNNSRKKHIIVMMDEVDVIFDKITNKKEISVDPNTQIGAMLNDKSDWNSFADNFDRNVYRNAIIVMTSNKPPSYIERLDRSYFREGRIDLIFEMEELIIK